MKKYLIIFVVCFLTDFAFGQDWDGISVPANAGEGKVWSLQESVSDKFNYTANAEEKGADFNNKWTDFYHNAWTGPAPTVWKRNHSFVSDGNLRIKASRPAGDSIDIVSGGVTYRKAITNLGCITSKERIVYPVYVEANVKIMKSVLASDVWLLSPDDTQEIDICEAYGGSRWTNEWFSNKRLHLSHHVFIRSPFQDWQPNDEGSFYTDGQTVWSDDYHRIGVFWKDPWNLEYYVDGNLVRTRSGNNEIDPLDYTSGTGLNKEMDIIINTEDQTWRAIQGLTPTDEELANEENNTFAVDWIRIYKPVDVATFSSDIKATGLYITPNPFKDYIHLRSDVSIQQLAIYNTTGNIILSEEVNGNVKTIPTNNLRDGVYLLKIKYEDGKCVSRKMIKQ